MEKAGLLTNPFPSFIFISFFAVGFQSKIRFFDAHNRIAHNFPLIALGCDPKI